MKYLSVGLLLGLLLLLVCVPVAEADGCRSVAFVRTPYVSKSYHAPTYNYGHDYYPQYYPVAIAPDYFWSVRDYYRDQLLADAIAFRILTANGGASKTPPEPIRGGQAPFPMPKATDAPERTETLPQGLQGLLGGIQTHCAACHTKGSEKGGLALLDKGILPQLTPEQVGKILHRVTLPLDNPQVMPPKGRAAMTSDQRMRFVNLLVGGGE